MIATAARRVIEAGHQVDLPQGYTISTLDEIALADRKLRETRQRVGPAGQGSHPNRARLQDNHHNMITKAELAAITRILEIVEL